MVTLSVEIVAKMAESQKEIPRFLFRGFSSTSGGNSALNTKDSITPHAFYGAGALPDPNSPEGKPVASIPQADVHRETTNHLTARYGNSYFRSWSQDWGTAISFAKYGSSSHIAVFDTLLRGKNNAIWHVQALVQARIVRSNNFIQEYLVYGPVQGAAYVTCVSIKELGYHLATVCKDDSNFSTVYVPATAYRHITPEVFRQAHVAAMFCCSKSSDENAGNVFTPGGIVFSKVKLATELDLYFTIVAAELARRGEASFPTEYGFRAGELQPWELELVKKSEVQLAIDHVAKMSPSPDKPLVNPRTYTIGLVKARTMVKFLQQFESEIDKKRIDLEKANQHSKPASVSQPKPVAGQKRRAQEAEYAAVQNQAKSIKTSTTLQKPNQLSHCLGNNKKSISPKGPYGDSEQVLDLEEVASKCILL